MTDCGHLGVYWKDCACPACGVYNVDGRSIEHRTMEERYNVKTATMRMLVAMLSDERRTLERPWDYSGKEVSDASKRATEIHNEIVKRLAKKIGSDKVFEWGEILLNMHHETLTMFDEADKKALAQVLPQVAEAMSAAIRQGWEIENQRLAIRLKKEAEEREEAERLRREKFHPKKTHRFAHL